MRRIIFFLICLTQIFASDYDFVTVDPGQVIKSDFIASSTLIEISGVCDSDVYVSGTQVVIDGIIKGDLICLCGSLQITGKVLGNVRGIAAQALISGEIGKNVTLAAASISITPSAKFGQNVFIGASSIDIEGTFNQNLYLASSHIRYSGKTMQNVQMYAGTIRIAEGAQILGFLEYDSPKPIKLQDGAYIKGGVFQHSLPQGVFKQSDIVKKVMFGSKIAAMLMNLFFTILVGIFMIKVWPQTFKKSLKYLDEHFIKSFMQGLLLVILMPIVGTILLITILGIPIAVTLIAFSILGLYSAKIHVLYFLSHKVKTEFRSRFSTLFLYSGLSVVYFLIQLVPVVDALFSIVFTLAGLGAAMYIPKITKRL